MSEPIVYLNGEFIHSQDAKVSVFDRGFLFGDGVYEVIPAYDGRLFQLPAHLDRLQHSLNGVRIANPYARSRWTAVLQELTRRTGRCDQSVYLQVTRGVAPTRTHAFPPQTVPTVFAMSTATRTMDWQRRARGARAITHDDIRWRRCDLKTTAMLANV
ncbi:MAG: aminotransferase class IV, partial [Gammaproteobacteria bacterium]|nr:aminotransferase class IV [Gammaproteobacteria bacterium]